MNWFKRTFYSKKREVRGKKREERAGSSYFSLLTSYSKFRLFTPSFLFRALRIFAVALVFVSGSLWFVPQVAVAANYTATQTSDAGPQDSCTSGGCVMPAGFNAGTSTSTNTAVSGTGSAAGVEGLDNFLTKTLDKRDNFIHKAWYS